LIDPAPKQPRKGKGEKGEIKRGKSGAKWKGDGRPEHEQEQEMTKVSNVTVTAQALNIVRA